MRVFKEFYDSGAIKAVVHFDQELDSISGRAFSEDGREIQVHSIITRKKPNGSSDAIVYGPIKRIVNAMYVRECVIVDMPEAQ